MKRVLCAKFLLVVEKKNFFGKKSNKVSPTILFLYTVEPLRGNKK